MNKTQQISHTTHNSSRRAKPRFIVTHEYNGSQSMRATFEQAIETHACSQFESWLEKKERGENAC